MVGDGESERGRHSGAICQTLDVVVCQRDAEDVIYLGSHGRIEGTGLSRKGWEVPP